MAAPTPGSLLPPVLTLEIIAALVLVEALVLVLLHRWRGWGVAPRLILPRLLAGLCLMLALRAALLQSGWSNISMWLSVAGLAHLLDLWRSWPSSRS
jgi:hypothetical protein